jgi:inorganic pyrophosphatase
MNIWHDISASRITPKKFEALIEIPKSCKTKYELDKETGILKLDRVLFTSTVYPANYGFIPRTLAEDGDPLDVLVLGGGTIYPMTLVTCYPIGVIKMIDGGELDEKIIAIPFGDPTYNDYYDVHELPTHIFDEMMHFFEIYKSLEHKQTTVKEICHRDEAVEIIQKCINAYEKEYGDRPREV